MSNRRRNSASRKEKFSLTLRRGVDVDATYKDSNDFYKEEELDLVCDALQGRTFPGIRSELR